MKKTDTENRTQYEACTSIHGPFFVVLQLSRSCDEKTEGWVVS